MPGKIDSLPILSICVPTFNRSPSLRNLFRSLAEVKLRFGSDIEICISNNGSTDDTAAVISDFQNDLDLRTITQETNIGGTRNIIAVTQIITGRWGILVGDDDELVPDSIGVLLDCLSGACPDDWILVEAENSDGEQQYFRQYLEGQYTNSHFRRLLLKTGLNPYGFMGVHVFPKSELHIFKNLQLEDAQPWPHIAAFLRKISECDGNVHVVKVTAIIQATGGAKLFWSGGDLARIRLAKIRILMRAYKDLRSNYWFHHLMMLRELYSISSIKSLLAWKLYEPLDFDSFAVTTYLQGYSWLGVFSVSAILHTAVVLALRVLPFPLYAQCLRLVGKGDLLSRYHAHKLEFGIFDGIRRGI